MVSPGAPPGVVPTGGGLQWVADSEAPIIRHQHTPGAAHRGPSAWPRRGSRPRLRFTGKPVTVQGQVIRFYFTGDSPPASLLPGGVSGGREALRAPRVLCAPRRGCRPRRARRTAFTTKNPRSRDRATRRPEPARAVRGGRRGQHVRRRRARCKDGCKSRC